MTAPINATTYGLRIASIDAALRLATSTKTGRPTRAGDVVASAKVFLAYLERGV